MVVTTAVAPACGDSSEEALAELRAANGEVEGSERDRPDAWSTDEPGAAYHRGDGIRTGAASSARVHLVRGGTLRMGERSLIRFGRAEDLQSIALETGEAEIETADHALVVDTAGGPARIAAGARVVVTRDGDTLHLGVVVGTAEIERRGAEAIAMKAGAEVAILASGAIEARRREVAGGAEESSDAGADPTAAGGSAGDAGAGAIDPDDPDGPTGPTLRGRAIELAPPPASVDMAIGAGETATLHATATPAHLRIGVGKRCAGATVIEVARGGVRTYYRGRGAVAVTLRRGRNRYRLLCEEDGELAPAGAGGVVRVLRDAGRRRVKTKAPTNTVEADGRTYRLLYQNRKPTVTFTWPRAPAADGYELVVTSTRGRVRRYPATKPRHTLPSGRLPEGTYTFRFRVPGGASSKDTRLVLDFDNAAPVAQLDRAAFGADGVDVRGLATVGSRVSIGGVAVPLDSDYRFKAHAPLPRGQRAIAVKIVRPGGAVHYYVKRAPANP